MTDLTREYNRLIELNLILKKKIIILEAKIVKLNNDYRLT